jgi:hypothetical protein
MKSKEEPVLLVDLKRLADFYFARFIVWRELRRRRRARRESERARGASPTGSPSERRSS